MNRRDILKSAVAGAAALATPRVVLAEAARTINFTPQADLASLDPVWTTADITRNFSLAVYDTLYGYDADFKVQPQMVDGHVVSNDGKQWDLTLRDGLAVHDGTPVLARDCVATIQRYSKRNPFGGSLMKRTDEVSAPSDKVIRFRLNKRFALLPDALAEKMEELRAAWFEAPDVAGQQKICEAMQVEFWQSPPYAPLGMYVQPTAYHKYLTDVRDGWPQFYGVKKNA